MVNCVFNHTSVEANSLLSSWSGVADPFMRRPPENNFPEGRRIKGSATPEISSVTHSIVVKMLAGIYKSGCHPKH